MNRYRLIFFFCFVLISFQSLAQFDAWPGTWKMEYRSGTAVIQMELHIALSERNILYPAHISLQCDSFTAGYGLLLVKKSSRELAISKNKYAVSEKPFSLADATFFLNGIFDYSRDFKGNPVLTLYRMQTKHQTVFRSDTLKDKRVTAENLLSFLKNTEIRLTKINSIPWTGKYSDRILAPSQSPAYFGLLDTIYVPAKDGFAAVSSSNKNDMATVSLNGRVIMDKYVLTKKTHSEDILLDTGLNILILFADNFSKDLPNKGKMNLEFGRKKINLDFSKKADSAACFIAAKLFFEKDKDKDIYFGENNLPDKPLKSNEKLLGNIVSFSKQLTLAVWDDAVEDGDSISININGKWVARGFPVKNKPQFITVTLKPGPNTITFVGDNLGSIPPNTSVLELIDGKRRKSFMLQTVPGENNLLKIRYNLKPD